MSRIHEALKKAEQERAAQQGSGPQAVSSVAELIESPAILGGPATAGSLDALLTRSAVREWKPDAAMLFANGGAEIARGTEEFRTLRSRLYQARETMPLKKILVTSALPKEGKSFTASNLAQVMARQHGRRALLIDADLRAPRLHQMFGTSNEPGLADFLQGKRDEFAIMQRGPIENLFFIPCGTRVDDPAELVGNGQLRVLLERVEGLFDWIIIDSPPAAPVSDASVLAKDCDGVLIVVRSNATPFDIARKAREQFPEQNLVGVVLNGTQEHGAPYARYYYDERPKAAKQEDSKQATRP